VTPQSQGAQGQELFQEEEEEEQKDEGDVLSGISFSTEPRTLSAIEHHETRSTPAVCYNRSTTQPRIIALLSITSRAEDRVT
jgi:hypothetical protein